MTDSMNPLDVIGLKHKYVRKYRGSGGEWQYVYNEPKQVPEKEKIAKIDQNISAWKEAAQGLRDRLKKEKNPTENTRRIYKEQIAAREGLIRRAEKRKKELEKPSKQYPASVLEGDWDKTSTSRLQQARGEQDRINRQRRQVISSYESNIDKFKRQLSKETSPTKKRVLKEKITESQGRLKKLKKLEKESP